MAAFRLSVFSLPCPRSILIAVYHIIAMAAYENRGSEAAAVAILFLVLSWIAVMLRVYVRGIMTKSFGIDDYLAVVTLVSSDFTGLDISFLSAL